MSYKIVLDQHIIAFTKLDTDEYEFTTTFNYMEYYGKSFLKGLSFVQEIDMYLKDMRAKIHIDYMDKYIMIQMPIPYSDGFELIELKLVEVDEFKKINIIIQKSSDVFKKQLCDLESTTEKFAEIIDSQENLNNELKSRLKIVENKYNKLNDQLYVMVQKLTQERHYLLARNDDKLIFQDIYCSHQSDEQLMIKHIKKNINIYMSGLTDQYVYDLKHNEHTLVSLFNSCNLLGGNTSLKIFKLMSALKYKITNNSVLEHSDIFIEYTTNGKFINYEVIDIGYYIYDSCINKQLKFSGQKTEVVNILRTSNGYMFSIIYKY